MTLVAGSVTVTDDGAWTGAGYAAVLFDAKVRALDAANPSPIAVPRLGQTTGGYSAQFPADQAAVDKAMKQRIDTLRIVAQEATQAASVIDYILANINISVVLTNAMSAGRLPASFVANSAIQPPAANLALSVTVQ